MRFQVGRPFQPKKKGGDVPLHVYTSELESVFCVVLVGFFLCCFTLSEHVGHVHKLPRFTHPHSLANSRRIFSSMCSIFLLQFAESHST